MWYNSGTMTKGPEGEQNTYKYRYTRKSSSLIAETEEPNPLYDSHQDAKLDVWWQTDVEPLIAAKVEIFGPDQGSIAATRAGQRVERESHEMEEDYAANELKEALAGGKTRGFSAKKIAERAKRTGRELGSSTGKTSLIRNFLGGEFIDILGESYTLSRRYRAKLKTSMLRNKLQI